VRGPARGEKHAASCRCAACARRRRSAAARRAAAAAEEEEATPDADAADGAEAADADGEAAPSKPRFPFNPEQVLSVTTAKQLRERVALLAALREALAAADSGGAVTMLQRSVAALGRGGPASEAAPYWWRPGLHDVALARGTLAHGYGAWARMAADDALPFKALAERAESDGEPLPPPSSRAIARRLRLVAAVGAAPGDEAADEPYEEEAAAPPPSKRRRAASAGVAAATAAVAASEPAGRGRRRRAVQAAPPPEEEEEEEEEEEAQPDDDDDGDDYGDGAYEDDEGDDGEALGPF
jgi:hypothetical protein